MNRFPIDDEEEAYRAGIEGNGQDMRYFASQRDRRVKRSISPFQKVCGVVGLVLLMALGYVVICLVLVSGQ